ncbi:hypothetical protein CPB84DRAFT_1750904 [Gymnopilus junonius]|uniref:Uncharacterized protein n=1 Tax=Gymnopilus junonius TaxID=109634 RepID=A0A9P5NCU8_GYMJU|nr:hypothetical protein CPB84DRAFT_1750904 [Gymnopilus junonius]
MWEMRAETSSSPADLICRTDLEPGPARLFHQASPANFKDAREWSGSAGALPPLLTTTTTPSAYTQAILTMELWVKALISTIIVCAGLVVLLGIYYYSLPRRTRMEEDDLERIELEAGGAGNIRRHADFRVIHDSSASLYTLSCITEDSRASSMGGSICRAVMKKVFGSAGDLATMVCTFNTSRNSTSAKSKSKLVMATRWTGFAGQMWM